MSIKNVTEDRLPSIAALGSIGSRLQNNFKAETYHPHLIEAKAKGIKVIQS